jgi:tRNA pseudouridine38-40 synthase
LCQKNAFRYRFSFEGSETFSVLEQKSFRKYNFTKKFTMRFKCTCAYDGTDFCGWQSQVGVSTIQDAIEKRLRGIFKEPVRIHSSGRTDAGVHAIEQVFHFDADWPHPPAYLFRALQSCLPEAISIRSVEEAADDFHSPFSATGKRYAYHLFLAKPLPHESRYGWCLPNRAYDVELMRKAAELLVGTHDFSAFRALRNDGSEERAVKTLRKLDIIVPEGTVNNPQSDPFSTQSPGTEKISIVLDANGFLYKMARFLVATLVDVGCQKLTLGDVETMLETHQRIPTLSAAPAKGLFLEKVFYDSIIN